MGGIFEGWPRKTIALLTTCIQLLTTLCHSGVFLQVTFRIGKSSPSQFLLHYSALPRALTFTNGSLSLSLSLLGLDINAVTFIEAKFFHLDWYLMIITRQANGMILGHIYIDRLTWSIVFSTHLLDVPFMSVIIEPEVNSLLHFYFLQHTTTSISFNFIPRSHKDKHTIIFCTSVHVDILFAVRWRWIIFGAMGGWLDVIEDNDVWMTGRSGIHHRWRRRRWWWHAAHRTHRTTHRRMMRSHRWRNMTWINRYPHNMRQINGSFDTKGSKAHCPISLFSYLSILYILLKVNKLT